MRPKTYICILLLIVASGLFSCKKEKEATDCKQLLSAPQEFLNYFNFPDSSYWVYRLQSDSNVIDTVIATLRTHYFEPMSGRDPGLYVTPCEMHYYQDRYHSNKTYFPPKSSYTYGMERFECSHRSGNEWYLIHYSGTRKLSDMSYILLYPFVVGQQYEYGAYLQDSGLSIVTPARRFNHTLQVSRDTTYFLDTAQVAIKNIYFTSNIGITKVEYTHNEVWELLSYKIRP